MRIIVDGKEAVLEKNIAFEYIRENPLFTDAEDYSMDITFPMKDCPENVSIFGPIHINGVDISTLSYPCEIISGDFYRSGVLAIVSVSEKNLKGQFLEGMSAQNFHSDLGSTYLTDLDYSQWDGTVGGWENFPDGDYAKGRSAGWIEFPVYDTASETLIEAVNQGDGYDNYSRHIYLWKLVDLIAQASGWKVNQSSLKRLSMYMHVVMVNSRIFFYEGERIRPLNLMVPRWTLQEFYEQVGKFFGCIVQVDKVRHIVTFRSYAEVAKSAAKVNLSVLRPFSVEVNTKETPKYRGARKYRLPDDANPDNINSCSFIDADPRIPHEDITKSNFLSLLAGHAAHSNDQRHTGQAYLYKLTDTGQMAVITDTDDRVKQQYMLVGENPNKHWEVIDVDFPTIMFQEAEILNQYGDMSDGEELKIVPCPCNGPFVDFIWSYTNEHDNQGNYWNRDIYKRKRAPAISVPEYDPDDRYNNDAPDNGMNVIEALSGGDRKKEDMYFDKLWVVLWEDRDDVAGGPCCWFTRKWEPRADRKKAEAWGNGWYTFKDENGDAIYGEYTSGFEQWSWNLCPSDTSLQTNTSTVDVDETKLYKFKFLGTTIPDPKNIFVINGKEYVCLRLKAHFTVRGMSELIEGEFYEIVG